MNLIIILCVAHVVWAEQLDLYHVKSKLEFSGPDTLSEDSFFGYSTTYDRLNKRLIISAPRESNIGEVYTCELSTDNNTCSKFGHKIKVADKYTHHYWFGATVRSSSNSIIACAPRYTAVVNKEMGMHGQCYRRKQSDANFTTDVRPSPSIRLNPSPEHDMETLGWSLDIGPSDYIIVGGPGMYNKKGQTVFSQTTNDRLLRMDNLNPKVAFNFGYSVAIGYFLSENEVSYAVSSTYGTRGPGQVFFYYYKNSLYELGITLKKEKDADFVGSMFGAVLCAANLNKRSGANASDLLVGAPTYTEKSGYNFGAVYVYVFYGKQHSPKYNRTIKGQVKGALFGSAIISLGDLNGDGADEVAIGAPYEGEGGRGAVYLYSGAAIIGAANLTWLQKLVPEDHYRSYGFSLAALQDSDDNGCNELAVSAPYVNKVILYRCMAAVTITELSATFPSFQDRTKSRRTEFKFKVCIKVQYPTKPKVISASLSTDVQITHSDVKLSAPNKGSLYNFITVLDSKTEEDCADVDITLPLNGRYSEEIIYNISTTLMNDPTNETVFTVSRVILSDVSKLTHSGMAWAAECKNNKECIPELKLKNINNNIKDPYIIGSSNKEALTFNIVNTGEVAYDPCLRITVVGARVYKPTDYCTKMTTVQSTWECTPMKPVLENDNWIIDGFTLELKGLTSRDTTMTINTTLIDNCRTKTTGEQKSVAFTLVSATEDVSISGRSNYGNILNMTQDDLLINGKRLEHTYEITNQGVTNFVDLKAIIKLPKEVYINYPTMPVTYDIDNSLETKGDNRDCVEIENTKTELTIKCVLPSLPKQSNVKVISYIDITASSQAYETILGRNVTLNTSLELFLPNMKTLHKPLSTLVTYQSASVALWILVLASLVGICLIIILALILYECGFLRRKNKEELEKLKTSVKRQTIRRSMMQQSQADDRLNILERMEEVDECPVDVQQPHP